MQPGVVPSILDSRSDEKSEARCLELLCREDDLRDSPPRDEIIHIDSKKNLAGNLLSMKVPNVALSLR